MNKIINSHCVCGRHLFHIDFFDDKKTYELIVLFPCEHIYHQRCYSINKDKDKAKSKDRTKECCLCQSKINKILTFSQIKNQIQKKDYTYYQNYIDMISVHHSFTEIDFYKCVERMIYVTQFLFQSYFIQCQSNYDCYFENILRILKINIHLVNKHKIASCKKIIISNHSNLFDIFVIYYVIRCHFLSSDIKTYPPYVKSLLQFFHVLFIKRQRNKQDKNVKKIMDHVNKYGDICIFPEGMFSREKTLTRFRTGAFHTGFPVQPVIIKYSEPIFNNLDAINALALISRKKLDIQLEILDLEQPPFDKNKIELIRHKMAKAGNFGLSRISNRDLSD
jgi:1-acyl-sn-glycerol-3-phosphate acyltransferase